MKKIGFDKNIYINEINEMIKDYSVLQKKIFLTKCIKAQKEQTFFIEDKLNKEKKNQKKKFN